MANNNSTSSLVVDGLRNVKGAFYDRDYVLQLSHGAFPPDNLHVEDVMTKQIISAQLDTSVKNAVSVITQYHFCIPVVSLPHDVKAQEFPLSCVHSVVTGRDILAYLVNLCDQTPIAAVEVEDPRSASSELGVITGSSSTDSSTDDEDMDDDALPHNMAVRKLLEQQVKKGTRSLLLNCRLSDKVTAADAANEMADKEVSCVIVVHDDGKMAGMFTAKDFLRRVVVPKVDATKTAVQDVMTTATVTAGLSFSVLDCARLMLSQNFRHLPVVDEDTKQCVGIVTVSDLLSVLVPAKTKGPRVSKIHEYMNMLVARRGSKKPAPSPPAPTPAASPSSSSSSPSSSATPAASA